MTPKEQYEARKAERAKLKDMNQQVKMATEGLMMLDMLDRFVTAAERIADAMDRPPARLADELAKQQLRSGLVPDQNSASGYKLATSG